LLGRREGKDVAEEYEKGPANDLYGVACTLTPRRGWKHAVGPLK